MSFGIIIMAIIDFKYKHFFFISKYLLFLNKHAAFFYRNMKNNNQIFKKSKNQCAENDKQ